jgi:hypothetical protein
MSGRWLYVFGGYMRQDVQPRTGCLNDLWRYHVDAGEWEEVAPLESAPGMWTMPLLNSITAPATDEQAEQLPFHFKKADGDGWPVKTEGHTLAAVEDSLYLFGGCTGSRMYTSAMWMWATGVSLLPHSILGLAAALVGIMGCRQASRSYQESVQKSPDVEASVPKACLAAERKGLLL